MTLELTAEEAGTLAAALRSYLGDLGLEIVDTDRVAMRATLKREKHVLASVLARLESIAPGADGDPRIA